ncbi:MAG: iron-containing alcohol dehydrogenase [bacterium]|nr:iron-containing alcohol dehydrogenase [bacterium]
MGIECVFMHPDRTIFGQGCVKQIGDCLKELDGKRAFLVTDKGVAGLDIFSVVEKALKDKGLSYYVYAEVDENPTDRQVEKGAEIYHKEKADVLVAVGGGSTMDSAKAIGVLISNGGSILEYKGMDVFTRPIPPLVAIPTTAGTGSEVTPYAVITNTKDNYKTGVCGWKLLPRVALVDPVMMAGMPPAITAATGMDALSHAVEAVYSKYAMPQTDALAYSAIKMVAENLVRAVSDGSDMEAREAMAMASLMGGMAMCAGCGAVHALGHQLSSRYGMPHGTAMSVLMPHILNFNASACPDRIANIAVALGEEVDGLGKTEAARKAAHAIRQLGEAVGLPTNLTEYGADPQLIPICADYAQTAGDMPGNPITPTMEQIKDLYKQAFEGNLGEV